MGQKSDNIYLLNLIVNTQGYGKVYTEKRGISKFRLVPRDQILNDLVPFFDKYPLESNKQLDYKDFKKIAHILNNKTVYNPLNQIKNIKNTNKKVLAFVLLNML